ncbi:hypothetical protein B0O99DRAFT_635601 [Bisporella sp. PMI_857]|nr:hypothetical protein B0O99DRAFT_635601 [Bisporella sp. PMI_857]
MTRHIEATGPSDLLQTPLAVRTAPGVSLTQNESNDQHIRNAINEGKNISGLLADNLKRSSLADNEESNLFQVLSLAGELRNYQSPVEFSIGLVGDSGVGKSSLINSLLDTENLAKTAGTGSACTTIVTEYRKKRESDTAAYTVEIERIGNPEMEGLLQQSVLDYRRYHLLDRDDPEGPDKTEIEQLRVKAELAWNTLIAAFVDRDGCTEVLFQNTGISTDEITQMVLGWKNQIIWPAGLDSSAAILTADSAPDCADQIEKLLKKLMWPFIKVVRIYLDAVVLQNGIILVDLPGFRDVNSARVRVTETRLYQCDEIFVVAEISRVVTNKGVEDLVVRQLGKNFNSLKRSQGVTIICTKSEDLGHESEILRDVPVTNEFNGQILGALQRQIEEAVENGEPERELRARRAHLFVSARNEHVKRHLVRHYASQRQVRTIDVYCVSNNLYREAADLQDGVQRSISNRRRSSNLGDRISAADQMLRSSGIPELRDFIQGIPVKSQIAETRHFLNTRLLSLLEKTQMWLTASASEIAANQAASPELVQEIQTELKAKFDTSVETSHGDLTNAKMEILHRPFSLAPCPLITKGES